MKYGSFIGGGIEVGPNEFRLGIKVIIKYWYSTYKIFMFYSQDIDFYTFSYGPKACKMKLQRKDYFEVVGTMLAPCQIINSN